MMGIGKMKAEPLLMEKVKRVGKLEGILDHEKNVVTR